MHSLHFRQVIVQHHPVFRRWFNLFIWRSSNLCIRRYINDIRHFSKPIEKPAGGFWRRNWRCQSLWSALLNALSAFQASNRPTSPQQQQYELYYVRYSCRVAKIQIYFNNMFILMNHHLFTKYFHLPNKHVGMKKSLKFISTWRCFCTVMYCLTNHC